MRNLTALFILLLFSTVSVGQEIHFFDVQGNRITKEQFEKQRDIEVNLGLSFQKGKITETRLVPRFQTGIIKEETRNTILLNLQEEIGQVVSKTELLIITYHQGKDRCNSSGGSTYLWEMKKTISQRRRQIKILGLTSEYYLYASPEGIRSFYSLMDWQPDKGLLVEKTFFKYKYPCKSFVLIKPNGEYYAYFGEFSRDHMINQAKAMLH